jgi:hypothetical protein
MADGEKERTARNRALLSRMGAPPTKAQVLTEIDFEIGDAIQLAASPIFRRWCACCEWPSSKWRSSGADPS